MYLSINGAAIWQPRRILEFGRLTVQVFLNHESNLEGYSVVELTKIKAGELSDLLKTVNKGVSMYKELS